MYLYRRRNVKSKRNRCSRKNAQVKAKNRRRKLRKSGLGR